MKSRLLIGVLPVVVMLAACGSGDDSTTLESIITTESHECRFSFRKYANGLADDPMVDEAPLQAATVIACASSDEWIKVAGEFQGPDESDLFPPKPIGGLEKILDLFCADTPEGTACP